MTDAGAQLIDLVLANGDIANHASGCDPETIAAAEAELGLVFPPSYRRLVERFGTWDIAGQEFLGVYRTAAMGSRLLGSVAETLEAREKHDLPFELIVVQFDGMGGLIVLDTSRPDEHGDVPVAVWSPGGTEQLADSFGPWALHQCQRAVARW